MRKIRTVINLPPYLKFQLDQIANEYGVPVTTCMLQALERFVVEEPFRQRLWQKQNLKEKDPHPQDA